MTIEAPRTITIDYQLGHVLKTIFEEVDETRKLEGAKCNALVNHCTNYLRAITTREDAGVLDEFEENRERLKGIGFSEKIISRLEIIAAREVIENLASKVDMYRSKTE